MKTPIGIDVKQYAIQGNAILGIKESGKTYTATAVAETLLDAKIPIVVFDPIGVWRYLKVGCSGPGYPVVVAGVEREHADLPLTPESAPEIVRAAMKENIPLILDLYSMHLSKSQWRQIVHDCLEILLYENKGHGLRHVFVEEAAEFASQRIGPQQAVVYGTMEKLARMGGNASLGYTLVSQRAEEVNKAVLELCDCLILHRQKGRHSLKALRDWLEVADVAASDSIIRSLPKLAAGHCWIWEEGSNEPTEIKVPQKKTVHPDRRNLAATTKGIPVNVDSFVEKLAGQIARVEKKHAPTTGNGLKRPAARRQERTEEPREMESKRELEAMSERVGRLEADLAAERRKSAVLERVVHELRAHLKPQYDTLRRVFDDTQEIAESHESNPTAWQPWLSKLHGGNRKMLEVMIERKRCTRRQLQFHAHLSEGGTFAKYIGRLKSLNLVKKEGDQFVLNEEIAG